MYVHAPTAYDFEQRLYWEAQVIVELKRIQWTLQITRRAGGPAAIIRTTGGVIGVSTSVGITLEVAKSIQGSLRIINQIASRGHLLKTKNVTATLASQVKAQLSVDSSSGGTSKIVRRDSGSAGITKKPNGGESQ